MSEPAAAPATASQPRHLALVQAARRPTIAAESPSGRSAPLGPARARRPAREAEEAACSMSAAGSASPTRRSAARRSGPSKTRRRAAGRTARRRVRLGGRRLARARGNAEPSAPSERRRAAGSGTKPRRASARKPRPPAWRPPRVRRCDRAASPGATGGSSRRGRKPKVGPTWPPVARSARQDRWGAELERPGRSARRRLAPCRPTPSRFRQSTRPLLARDRRVRRLGLRRRPASGSRRSRRRVPRAPAQRTARPRAGSARSDRGRAAPRPPRPGQSTTPLPAPDQRVWGPGLRRSGRSGRSRVRSGSARRTWQPAGGAARRDGWAVAA